MQSLWDDRVKKVMLRRKVIFFIMSMAFSFAVAHRVAPVVVADRLMDEFNITGTLFGYLVATYFFVYTVMQIPSGMLADYLGPRKTVTAGVALAGVGSILIGLSDSLQFLFFSRFLVGLGCSVIFVSLLKVGAEWFRISEFATLSGVSFIVGGIGNIAATYPFAAMVEKIGWRVSFEIVGGISIIIAAFCWLLVRNRPADVGLPDITQIEALEKGVVNFENPEGPVLKAETGIGLMDAFRMAVQNRFTWPPFFAILLIYGPAAAFMGVISMPYFMHVYQLTREQAAVLLLMLSLGGAISGPLVGYLSDRVFISRKKPYILFGSLYLCTWLVFIYMNKGLCPLGVLYLILFIMGFTSNGTVLTWVCAKEVNHPSIAGIASGTVNCGGMMGVALLQPFSGFLLDLGWRGAHLGGARAYPPEAYGLVFIVFAISAALGLVAVFMIKETSAKNIYQKIEYEKD